MTKIFWRPSAPLAIVTAGLLTRRVNMRKTWMFFHCPSGNASPMKASNATPLRQLE